MGSVDHARSTPVPGLGDEAFLLPRDDSELTFMVRHGGAVFVLDPTGVQRPVDPADPPTDANGCPVRPPGLSRYVPAMEQSLRQVMAALAT